MKLSYRESFDGCSPRWGKRVLMIVGLLVTLALAGLWDGKNVSAETNPNGCNKGDKVTLQYGKKGADPQSLEVIVEGPAVAGTNFEVAVGCFEDKYFVRHVKVDKKDTNFTGDDPQVPKVAMNEMNMEGGNQGDKILWLRVGGVDFGIYMSDVVQGDSTDPATGEEYKTYDTSTTKDQNSKEGAVDDTDETFDVVGENECYDGSGAIGWIICPIIEGISSLGNWLWGEVEENFMQIDSVDMFQKNDGVQKAWSIFRDMANVVFVILFLFVIFSQLTGVGIDNYGIKKIMPKLIIVAILINLSYVLCILAVDLSNILGSGLNALFSSMASSINVEVSGASAGQSLVSAGLVGGGAVLFLLISNPISAFAMGAALGLTVLGAAVTIVFSIIFLYIILVLRYAGVVLLIAIAPIAIVCYMLPNTEKLFRQWINLLKALLMVYPICGALVGAGKLAGNVLASTGNDTMKVAGMIVSVIPFFLIPMLLKRSLALAGNIGARLSSMGRTAGRGVSRATSGAITGSEKFKNWSAFQGERRGGIRAERLMNRLNRRAGGDIQNLSQRDRHRLLDATNTANAWRQKDAQAGVGAYELDENLARTRAQSSKRAQELKSYSDQYSTLTRTSMGNELNAAVAAYQGDRSAENATRLEAAIAASESRGMNKEMLNTLGGLKLSAGRAQDANILNQLSGSNDKVISQFGRQMSKPANAGADLSMNEFAGDTGSVKMSAAFAEAGPNTLVGANDDTLEYIKNHGRNAATDDMLVNAATNTNSPKELRQINEMFATSADPDKITFSGNQLSGLDSSTVLTLASRIKPGSKLQETFIKASDDLLKSPEKLNSLHPESRRAINAIRKGAGETEI